MSLVFSKYDSVLTKELFGFGDVVRVVAAMDGPLSYVTLVSGMHRERMTRLSDHYFIDVIINSFYLNKVTFWMNVGSLIDLLGFSYLIFAVDFFNFAPQFWLHPLTSFIFALFILIGQAFDSSNPPKCWSGRSLIRAILLYFLRLF